MGLQCLVNIGLWKRNEIFFSSVHQFCYSPLLSLWILHPLDIPENSVAFGVAGDRRRNAGSSSSGRV